MVDLHLFRVIKIYQPHLYWTQIGADGYESFIIVDEIHWQYRIQQVYHGQARVPSSLRYYAGLGQLELSTLTRV